LNEALGDVEAKLERAGRALSASRKRVIPKLAKAASAQLADLGFKQARFDAVLSELRPAAGSQTIASTTGCDSIEFQFAPNPGESPRPLRAIASSGEMARVMLALKTVLAAQDEVPVLIFDEVDANVGGETANAVGEKMRQIGVKRQVLCITHLPQVASAASTHFAVTKSSQEGRTVTEIQRLEGSSRVAELSRMLGGQTGAARKHAESLLRRSSLSETPGRSRKSGVQDQPRIP
jgi:DNA repair protein RecN (Recombination protein N)